MQSSISADTQEFCHLKHRKSSHIKRGKHRTRFSPEAKQNVTKKSFVFKITFLLLNTAQPIDTQGFHVTTHLSKLHKSAHIKKSKNWYTRLRHAEAKIFAATFVEGCKIVAKTFGTVAAK